MSNRERSSGHSASPDFRRRLFWAGLAASVLLAAAALLYLRTPHRSSRGETGRLSIAGVEAGYVDSQLCATCHRTIWETYRRTGMGKSFARVRPGGLVEVQSKSGDYYHELSDQHYRTYENGGRYYQRRQQTGFRGAETNAVEKELHFVIGSGNHVRSYLHRTPDGRIFELPLSWYAENGGLWRMTPGYDRPDHDNFRRQISGQCLFCHTGYPEIAKNSDRSGTPPIFPGAIPEGIDCQRCHGPGQAHVAAAQATNGERADIQRAIVNPARLSPDRQLDLCMQCHLETTSFRLPSSLVRYNRGIFSFRPGEPPADYVLHFDHPEGSGYDEKFEIAGAAYRLRISACFLASPGSLKCTTCHNPHDIPRGAEAERHYTSARLKRHAAVASPLAAIPAHRSATGCVSCHMPQRLTDDVVHAAVTDHLVQRRPPSRDLLAPVKERSQTETTAYKGEVIPYYPPTAQDGEDEMYLAVAQVRQGANLEQGIPRLEKAIEKHRPKEGRFYFEMAEAYWKARLEEKAVVARETALRLSPDFWPAGQETGRPRRSE